MKIKDVNSWIAIIFLVFLFLLPTATLLGATSTDKDMMASANEVLTNNGTAGKETVPDAEGNITAGENSTEGEIQNTENSVSSEKKNGFIRLQNSLNDFTQKLFLRSTFIEGNTKLTAALTGGTYMESTQVLLGKEDWLFYKTENDGYPIYDYMGINHFSEEELAAMADNLLATRDYLENEKGITFIATTIPNKEIIYEEYMPDTIARVNAVSRGEQLANYIKENTDIRYVYPKQEFIEQKENYPLFYKTDTHWNHIGAFVGVQELFKELYGDSASPDSVIFEEMESDFAGDLSVIAGISDEYSIDTIYQFNPDSVDSNQKRDEIVIVVGDSFGGFLSEIARGYYSEVHWIDTEDFTISMIDDYDADIVIWETVERLQETYMTESLLD